MSQPHSIGAELGHFLIGESSERCGRHWLHSIVYTEQIEEALLPRSGGGDEVEGHRPLGGAQYAVFGHGCQVTQQDVEAVERSAILSEFGQGLALRTQRALSNESTLEFDSTDPNILCDSRR